MSKLTSPAWFLLSLALTLALLAAGPARGDSLTPVRDALGRSEWALALQLAEAVTRDQPQNAQARFLLAVALMEMGRDEQALVHFSQLNQEFPELPEPLNNIALLRARAGELQMAREALEAALRNDPGHGVARANLGLVHLMLAVRLLEQAAAAAPSDATLQRRLKDARALLAPLPR